MLALGLIETRGLVGAIEGADVMLKAADVRLLEKNLASGGLVTISISGEVAAVRAAVDAAVAAIKSIKGSILVSRHVIARPDVELKGIISLQTPLTERQSTFVPLDLSQLKKMNVSKLRQVAMGLGGLSLSREELATAGKKELVEAIIKASRQSEE